MAANDKTEAEIMCKVKFVREKMEKFRAVCHSNGYPCGLDKMGLNNVPLMSGSTVSENVSGEMSPAILHAIT